MTPGKPGTQQLYPLRLKVDSMYSLAQRLLRVESEADKEEFVRGVAGLDPDAGKKKVLVGLISGVLLAKVLKK